MSLLEQYRERHTPRRSGFRVVFYVVLLALTLWVLCSAGRLTRSFTEIFLQDTPSEETR